MSQYKDRYGYLRNANETIELVLSNWVLKTNILRFSLLAGNLRFPKFPFLRIGHVKFYRNTREFPETMIRKKKINSLSFQLILSFVKSKHLTDVVFFVCKTFAGVLKRHI